MAGVMSMREAPARNVSSAAEARCTGRRKKMAPSKAMTWPAADTGIGFMEFFMFEMSKEPNAMLSLPSAGVNATRTQERRLRYLR